ncbi:MAG: hypothetical protein HY046_13620 [Acidobacteria bacterium]|nr:hypothetical protein [Acidobacteriota bacterium]
MRCSPTALVILLFAALPCAADEITLKDGTKLTGSIVGYEKDSFKVETSYGFALVRKDKVASIVITDAPKKAEEPKPAEKTPEKKETVTAPPPAVATPAPTPEPPMRESVEGNTYTTFACTSRQAGG